MDKKRKINILLTVIIALLVIFVVITSIVLYQRQKKLDDLKEKNEVVKPDEEGDIAENKIFLKNVIIFY